ncbi:hypothetical protein AA313_de0209369 [Arthrobotrys entomopaga]|nr:hypothetical protein AA313_de0209369 [Arthrobotrys entomopaga]
MEQPAAKIGFTSLPVELQTEILFYLSFDDQVIATQTCAQWHSILLETKAALNIARKTRYSSDPSVHGCYMNRLLRPETVLGIDPKIACIIRKGSIVGTYFLYYRGEPMRASRHAFDLAEPTFALNISRSTLLDEPYLSPFVKKRLQPRDPSEVHRAIKCPEINDKPKLFTESIDEKELPSIIADNVLLFHLQFGSHPHSQICNPVYYLMISGTTTIREMITQYAVWVNDSLREIGVGTDQYFKAYFRTYGSPLDIEYMRVRVDREPIPESIIYWYLRSGRVLDGQCW